MNIVRRVESLEQRTALQLRSAPAEPVALDTPADVLAVLAEQANAVRADTLMEPVERARTLVSIAAVALRAIESRDLAARLEAVERVLKLRKAEAKEASSWKR